MPETAVAGTCQEAEPCQLPQSTRSALPRVVLACGLSPKLSSLGRPSPPFAPRRRRSSPGDRCPSCSRPIGIQRAQQPGRRAGGRRGGRVRPLRVGRRVVLAVGASAAVGVVSVRSDSSAGRPRGSAGYCGFGEAQSWMDRRGGGSGGFCPCPGFVGARFASEFESLLRAGKTDAVAAARSLQAKQPAAAKASFDKARGAFTERGTCSARMVARPALAGTATERSRRPHHDWTRGLRGWRRSGRDAQPGHGRHRR